MREGGRCAQKIHTETGRVERDWGGSAKAVAFESSLACLEDQNDLNRQRCAVCLCMCVRVHACARARVRVCVWMVQVAMREMGEDEGNWGPERRRNGLTWKEQYEQRHRPAKPRVCPPSREPSVPTTVGNVGPRAEGHGARRGTCTRICPRVKWNYPNLLSLKNPNKNIF